MEQPTTRLFNNTPPQQHNKMYKPLILIFIGLVIIELSLYFHPWTNPILHQHVSSNKAPRNIQEKFTNDLQTYKTEIKRQGGKKHILLVMGILSKIIAINRRTAIRETWYQICLQNPSKVKCRFFTDKIRNNTKNKDKYIKEMRQHVDLEYMPYRGMILIISSPTCNKIVSCYIFVTEPNQAKLSPTEQFGSVFGLVLLGLAWFSTV